MFWSKKKSAPLALSAERCAHGLYEFFLASLKNERGVRVEDLVSALATVVGERCIAAAGDFDVRTHTMAPGTRVFSGRINELLCGDVSDGDITAIPAVSVFGALRDRLVPGKYSVSDFPSLKAIFEHFAASVGNKDDWGKAPLSIPDDHHPILLPLRVAYTSRDKVDSFLDPLGPDAAATLRGAVLALAEALNVVAGAIDHRLVLSLAFETVNGMAKTAPMTDAAMAETARTLPPE